MNVTLISSEGSEFVVPEEIARKSSVIDSLLLDTAEMQPRVPLPNVRDRELRRLIEFCTPGHGGGLPRDKDELVDFVLAANYLNVPGALDASCLAVARMLKSLDPDTIRAEFGIENTMTAEEERQVRLENEWAFD